MAYKSLARSFNFQIALVALSGAVMVGTIALGWWGVAPVAAIGIVYGLARMKFLYVRNMRKLAFMLDAIDNNDYAFKYRTTGHSQQDELVNETLNRITQILFQAKADAVQREKYYELILNSVGTGIVVVDDRGNVYQHNNAALHLLGLSIFTHVNQLEKIDERLMSTIKHIQPGEKQQVSFSNERGAVHLSLRVSEMTLQDKHVRIITLNDINNELDAKELDSWMRLTRVLTHEIMNSVTPITSLSDTLLSIHENVNPEIRDGLEVISSTGKSLIAFVESYRKFTHIPTPQPTLFYVHKLAERTVRLAEHQLDCPNIRLDIDIHPDDLIVYADENLISQVILNLLKNAMQAIGPEKPDGRILFRAYSNDDDSVVMEVSNNGPAIPPEEAEHIFVPFFTTKQEGSGIGLSISRQIMRLSGGSLTLKSSQGEMGTTFVLTFR